MIIEKDDLLKIIKKELNYTKYLKNIQNIELMILRQVEKESSFFIYSTRYEKSLNDMSLGIFQLLSSTMKWLGFKGEIKDMFSASQQTKYAVKYLDYLYLKFPEIRNPKERIKIMFSSYNCGKGTINKAIKLGLRDEEINYEGERTIQGKWSTYKKINMNMVKYKIVSERNAEINRRYVNFITGGLL